jgi:hypothetical protein
MTGLVFFCPECPLIGVHGGYRERPMTAQTPTHATPGQAIGSESQGKVDQPPPSVERKSHV